METKVINKSKG